MTASGSAHVVVRPALAGDASVLAAFNQAMAKETEQRELDPAMALSGTQRLLAMPEAGFYLLAMQDGVVRGSLMVTPEWSDWRCAWFWWIQSVYVEPAARGQGLYRRLHEDVRRRAQAQGDVCGLRLYVERDNRHAREVYVRLGMSESIYRLYEEGVRATSGS